MYTSHFNDLHWMHNLNPSIILAHINPLMDLHEAYAMYC